MEYLICFARKKENTKTQEQQIGLLKGNQFEPKMYLNKGEEDEMEINCYKRRFNTIVTYIFTIVSIIFSCGVLGLIFHWYPTVYLRFSSKKCKVDDAEKVLIKEKFSEKTKNYYVKRIKILSPEVVKKLKNEDNLNHNVLKEDTTVFSVHFEKGQFRNIESLLMFTCKKVTYIWDVEKQEFVKLSGLDNGVPCDILHGMEGLDSNDRYMRRLVYGPNKILVQVSSIPKLLVLEMLDKLFLFQLFSFILWFYDNYYYYSAAIMFMSLFGIGMNVYQTRDNEKKLKSTVNTSDTCTVLKQVGEDTYESERISTEHLVPGDLLEIPANGCVLHCDALLLQGNCILNESMLTGESVPVTKTPIDECSNLIYNPKDHAKHTLFSGTSVLQTRCDLSDKVFAVVIRTGFSTAKGSLVRSILYPPPVDHKFERESYRFLVCLGFFALIGMIYTVVLKIHQAVPVGDMIVEALDLVTIVVPPALPAAMSLGRFWAERRLKRKQIFCISPRTIIVTGSIDCVCFDKTGTLTEDGLDLKCVTTIQNKSMMSQNDVENVPCGVFLRGMVSCHSLTIIDEKIVGDPLDLKMFESTKWIMEENVDKSLVLKSPDTQHSGSISIIRSFPFSSELQRMGVIIKYLDSDNRPNEFDYYCKGSSKKILSFVKKDTVPHNFHSELEKFTQQGYRVIALAHKKVVSKTVQVMKMKQYDLEKDLTLLGLIVFENRLKSETKKCIQQLNDANIRVIMVTGDDILTALSVARECDIIRHGQSVITVNADNKEPPNLYYTLNSTKSDQVRDDLSMQSNSVGIMSLDTMESQTHTITASLKDVSYNNYKFAMTGDVWDIVKEDDGIVDKLVTRGSVFARMSPENKQQLVQKLQTLDYCVAMCGDGANDCGALKAAHAGISLSEAESSVASPFTSKDANISCVLNVIREGRSALVTGSGIFKFMASYSFCQFVSVLILYSIESNLSDWEFLFIDIGMIALFTFFFVQTESYPGKIVKQAPSNSLMSINSWASLVLQIVIVIIFQVIGYLHLQTQDWFVQYHPPDDLERGENGCWENFTIYTISSFQYAILAIVFSKGKPYRKTIFSNYGFIICLILAIAFCIYITLDPAQFLIDGFQLVLPVGMEFRYILLAYALGNLVISVGVEHFCFDYEIVTGLLEKMFPFGIQTKKFNEIDRDLDKDTKWPSLTSDFNLIESPTEAVPEGSKGVFESVSFERNHIFSNFSKQVPVVEEDYSRSVLPPPSSAGTTPKRSSYFIVQSDSGFHSSYPNTPNRDIYHSSIIQQNGIVSDSQEELPFSSLPHENLSSASDTFQSLSNNTSHDLTNSRANIPDLPYDGSDWSAVTIKGSNLNSTKNIIEMNSFDQNR